MPDKDLEVDLNAKFGIRVANERDRMICRHVEFLMEDGVKGHDGRVMRVRV